MALLVVPCERVVEGLHVDFANSWCLAWEHGCHAARREARRCDVLCFGDSLVKYAVLPQVLQKQLGVRAYNMALPGGPSMTSYFLLRRAIQAGSRPSAVVVDFLPYLLTRDSWSPADVRLDGQTWWECCDLALTARDSRLFLLGALRKLLPSFRARYEIKSVVAAALFRGEYRSRLVLMTFVRNWNVNRGAHIVSGGRRAHMSDAEVLKDLWLNRRMLYPESWKPDHLSDSYLRRFVKLAAEHGITVYWLLPPSRRGVQQQREQLGIESTFVRYVISVQRENPNLVVLDGRCSNYVDETFADAMHLNPHASAELTFDLASIMKPRRERRADSDAPRWIHLPDYHDQAPEVELEDLAESSMALHRGAGRSRRR